MVHTQFAPSNRYEAAMMPVRRDRAVATMRVGPSVERDDAFARAVVIALPVSLALWVPILWAVSHLI